MYRFLKHSIRREDQIRGNQFVERLFRGPQDVVFDGIWDRTEEAKDLWSLLDCPDEYLQYLKNIVGWTKDLNRITDGLDSNQLRRLISVSARLWKTRGSEDSLVSILRLLTGMRATYYNWFDLRWVWEETGFWEEHEGTDPWITADDNQFDIRIVDQGNLNRQLVLDVCRLMRPAGERISVLYLAFLDLFDVEGDYYQWSQQAGASMAVGNGMMTLSDTSGFEAVVANTPGASAWSNYMFSAKVRTASAAAADPYCGLLLCWGDIVNTYFVNLDFAGSRLILRSVVGGVATDLATVDLLPFGITLHPDLWYTVRAEVLAAGDRKVYLDGQLVLDVIDTSLVTGTVGIFHGPNYDLDCDEAEVLGLPAESDFIDINT